MQEFYGVLFVLGDLGDLGDLGVPCKCELRTSENVHFVLSLVRILSFFSDYDQMGVYENHSHMFLVLVPDLIIFDILKYIEFPSS